MKKYQIIYADPPWRYDFSETDSRAIENQYPTMSVEDICALPVPSEKDSVLYLWATAPKLLEALNVMKSWGFEYKTHAIWDKGIMGMGYWFRGQHELLLIGTKGHFSPPEEQYRISSVMKQQRSNHSSKPDAIRLLISEWYPKATKLEMFARENKTSLFMENNWDIWGNEVKSDIELAPKI